MTDIRIADIGNGGHWGWQTLGMADIGDGRHWGWQTSGVMAEGQTQRSVEGLAKAWLKMLKNATK